MFNSLWKIVFPVTGNRQLRDAFITTQHKGSYAKAFIHRCRMFFDHVNSEIFKILFHYLKRASVISDRSDLSDQKLKIEKISHNNCTKHLRFGSDIGSD